MNQLHNLDPYHAAERLWREFLTDFGVPHFITESPDGLRDVDDRDKTLPPGIDRAKHIIHRSNHSILGRKERWG